MKKGVFIIIAVIFLLAAAVLGFITYSYFNNKKDMTSSVEKYKENEETKENLIAYKELKEEEKNSNFFQTKNFSLDVISYASKSDSSYVSVKVNNKVIYNSKFYVTKFRVYSFNNLYFIELVSNKLECETKELILLNDKGKLDHLFNEKIDDWLSPLDVPTLSDIAFNNNTLDVTYKSCSKCEIGNKIGYTYTYNLDNFKLLNTKEITCE